MDGQNIVRPVRHRAEAGSAALLHTLSQQRRFIG